MRPDVTELLKSKARLLLMREKELSGLRLERDRTSAWLSTFHRISVGDGTDPPGLCLAWAECLVGELGFQFAAVYRRLASGEAAWVAGQGSEPLPARFGLETSAWIELLAAKAGLASAGGPALAQVSAGTGLGQYCWCVDEGSAEEPYLLLAGFAAGTEWQQAPLDPVDAEYFAMVGRELLGLLHREALRLALESERAQLADSQQQLRAHIAELLETREKLIQAEKRALVGRLGGSFAHELNNPLAALLGNLEVANQGIARLESLWRWSRDAAAWLAHEREPAPAELGRRFAALTADGTLPGQMDDYASLIADALDGGKRIGSLAQDFRRLSQMPRTGLPRRVDLGAALAGIVAELPECRARVSVGRVDAGCHSVVVEDDLMNGLREALVFLAEGPAARVHLELAQAEKGARLSIHVPTLELSAEERREIFDPRVRTRERVLRLTLALTVADQLLNRNGAVIRVVDAGAGTTFVVDFPPG